MALQSDRSRRNVLNRWDSLCSAAVRSIDGLTGLLSQWAGYRASLDKDADSQAEVDGLTAVLRMLAGSLATKPGSDADEQTITDLLTKFDPAKRERTPTHAGFLSQSQLQAGLIARDARLKRADLNAFAATLAGEDNSDAIQSVTFFNDALTAIANDDAVALATAKAGLAV